MALYAWERLDVERGLGSARLWPHASGFECEAVEVIADRGCAWVCRYRVALSREWITREGRVEVLDQDGWRNVEFRQPSPGTWLVDGKELDTPPTCVDVDVASTPLTNTFPIRRLSLDVGAARDIEAVWIAVPELDVEVVRQRYERLSDDGALTRYRYIPIGSTSTYDLTVDRDGVVVDYERFAKRVGESDR